MKATISTYTDVHVDDSTLYQEADTRLLTKCGITSDQWIDDQGYLCEDEDHYHGSVGTKRLGPATAKQRAAYEAVKACKRARSL